MKYLSEWDALFYIFAQNAVTNAEAECFSFTSWESLDGTSLIFFLATKLGILTKWPISTFSATFYPWFLG